MDENHVVSDKDWDVMKAMISTQIDNIPKNVTVDTLRQRGTLETIAHQISRGDRNPQARMQCWYISMLEIEVSSKPLGLQKIHYLFNQHQHSKEGLKSFVLDTTMTQTSGNDDDEWKRRSIVARLEGKAKLSVVERQQLWQAKKDIALNSIRQQEQSKAARERKLSAPDLTKSRKSFVSNIKSQSQSKKRSGDEDYLNNITNQNGSENKRVKVGKI
jgi:hypothetical protein